MFSRGRMTWLSPTSFPLYRRKLSLFLGTTSVELTDEKGGGRGAKSYDDKRALPSVNPSGLSGYHGHKLGQHDKICQTND